MPLRTIACQKNFQGQLTSITDPLNDVGWTLSLAAVIGLGVTGVMRMMWFTPVLGGTTVVLVSVVAAALSARPGA